MENNLPDGSLFAATPGSANLALDQTREAPQIKTTLPQIRVYFKPPSHCCQRCGENIGWIGRFLFPFLHDCCKRSNSEAQDSPNNAD